MMQEVSGRAVVLAHPLRTQVTEIGVPLPGADEVRVRLQGCGICASNVPVWEGRPWFHYPLPPGSPGHEGWGIVDAVGSAAQDLQVGERVAVISGRAYAEYDIAPMQALVRLPDVLHDLPFPGEPLGCAMNIFERSDIRSGQQVAVVGAGFVGLLLVQLAAGAGAEVLVLSRRQFALDLACKMGAGQALSTVDAVAAREEALRLSCGKGYERVIEAGGLQATLDLASALSAEYGRLIIAGYHQDGLRQIDLQQWNWRALDVINAHERSVDRYAAGVQSAVNAVLAGRLDPFPLLTHEVTLDTLGRGFELTRSRPEGFVKAVLRIEGEK